MQVNTFERTSGIAYVNSRELAISRDLASRGEHSLSTRIAVRYGNMGCQVSKGGIQN